MSEAFLHYIWQYQYFDKNELLTVNKESLDVFKQGFYNTDAGPDFKEATIKINDIEWRGHVEIHYKSSDWHAHGHQTDKAYNSTVLHVVWEDDKPVSREDQTAMPTLELKDRVPLDLQKKYTQLIKNGESIPCASQLHEVSSISKLSMIEKSVFSRLERKSKDVLNLLKDNEGDWEETTFQLLAKNYGFKINAEPFFQLAQSVPFKVLKKHADQPNQVEALLFGQAGFLEEECAD
ncbi:DUF2851 family protein, partial [Fulvivirga sp. RKSG066]|uniref:DUF2851 family protein n=1 Tax=Fulvivirga aurantia TaxID=2529383 RepID=UPI0012BC6F63